MRNANLLRFGQRKLADLLGKTEKVFLAKPIIDRKANINGQMIVKQLVAKLLF